MHSILLSEEDEIYAIFIDNSFIVKKMSMISSLHTGLRSV